MVKPSKKQSGGLLGTMLASIGIPLVLEMAKNLFGKGAAGGAGAPRLGKPKGKGAPRIGRPKGKGAPRLGTPFQRPPPFFGNWGQGMEKKNQREKDFCWDRKAHFKTSQFSGRYCECETKIREQTPE